MNILLLGSGGREDALAWRLRQSPSCDALRAAATDVKFTSSLQWLKRATD